MKDFAHGPSTIKLGDLEVCRLGFGAMQLPGKGVWGEPDDRERAKKVLRRALELGVTLIDTAWYYGPHVSNRLILEALHPYPRALVIATKLGGTRTPDKGWRAFAKPEQLREGLETDLKSLKLDRIDVVHLRYIAQSGVPFLESLDALIEEKKKGRIRHIGLSNVSPANVTAALERTPIVSVQNMYTVSGGGGAIAQMAHAEVEDPEGVLALCEKHSIAYLPFFPLAMGRVEEMHPGLAAVAKKRGASASQLAIAWLLARSPVMLPIPGTGSPEHLEENCAAHSIKLDPAEIKAIAG